MGYELTITPASIVAMCGGLITISGAIAVIVKAFNMAKKPYEDRDEKIKEIDKKLIEHGALIAKDDVRLRQIEDDNRITLRALLALLDHGLDGNNIESMKRAKANIQNHLIER